MLPRLGEYELRRITPAVIAEFADELRRDGVGDATVRKVLSLVQGVLGRAVVLGRIRANPVVPIRKPVQGRRRAVRPLTPTKVEQLRRLMPTDQDATLVSVLAYAGLRPGEALALTWGDVGERTILVERSVALGDQERHERVAEVVGPDRLEPCRLRRRLEHAPAPVAPVGVSPRLAVRTGKDQLFVPRPPALHP